MKKMFVMLIAILAIGFMGCGGGAGGEEPFDGLSKKCTVTIQNHQSGITITKVTFVLFTNNFLVYEGLNIDNDNPKNFVIAFKTQDYNYSYRDDLAIDIISADIDGVTHTTRLYKWNFENPVSQLKLSNNGTQTINLTYDSNTSGWCFMLY